MKRQDADGSSNQSVNEVSPLSRGVPLSVVQGEWCLVDSEVDCLHWPACLCLYSIMNTNKVLNCLKIEFLRTSFRSYNVYTHEGFYDHYTAFKYKYVHSTQLNTLSIAI
jgi:hypothetical protein